MSPRFMALLLAAGSASAADPHPLPAWAQELSDAYAGLPGYIVTYRATGKDTVLDVTLGMDEASKTAVTYMRGTKRGEKLESRLWNTAADQNFSDGGKQLKVCQGVQSELVYLKEIDLLLGVEPGGKPLADFLMTPRFMMGPKSLEPACNLRHKDSPWWLLDLAWARLKESDKESVTVESERYGLIKFDKKTGMLLRQSIKGEDGSERVVEMKEFKADPGKAGIAALSSDWDTSEAEPSTRLLLTLLHREYVFQKLIDRVDKGEIELAKLETTLNREKELLRRFAGGLGLDSDGEPGWEKTWTDMIEESKTRMVRTWPGETEQERVKGVETYLSRPSNRAEIRDEMAQRLVEDPESRKALAMIFRGKPVWGFVAKTDVGNAAKTLVETTLISSYFEAKLDGEMAERWGR